MYYYGKNSRRLTGKRIRWEMIFFLSSFLLPKVSRVTGTEKLPKFSFGTRAGAIIDHILIGGRLIRAKLFYCGWSYHFLPFDPEIIDYYKKEKIRFLAFQTSKGMIWVRHECCAFTGRTVVIVPSKKIK